MAGYKKKNARTAWPRAGGNIRGRISPGRGLETLDQSNRAEVAGGVTLLRTSVVSMRQLDCVR